MCHAALLSRIIVVISVLVLSFSHTKGQTLVAPGGVQGAALWSRQGDSSDFFANYHTLNLLKLRTQADSNIPPMLGGTTLFLVLKPNFTAATGAQFLELGDILLYDNRLIHGSSSTQLDFSDGNPMILTLLLQRSVRSKAILEPKFRLLDSSLFSIAELIYYPSLTNREEIQRVHSYLAVKYSVPITKVKDPDWRDYWTQSQSRYWDHNIDKVYDLRVLGIGKSIDEDLYQSQTQSSSSSYISWSIDSIKSQGVMPLVGIAEDAFLIFSERVPAQQALQFPCLRDGANPLGNWKLKPQGWSSAGTYLYASIQGPSKGTVSDSIWMTDGSTYTYVPVVGQNNGVFVFRIPLSALANGLHYFFTDIKGNPCDELSISTVDQELTVDNGGLMGGLRLRHLDYSSGLITEEELPIGVSRRAITPSQHQVWIVDQMGHTVMEKIVFLNQYDKTENESINVPSIQVAPNPVAANQNATVTISQLPDVAPVFVRLIDPSGRLIHSTKAPYSNGMQLNISAPSPGLYTIEVVQNSSSYSQKLMVLGQ